MSSLADVLPGDAIGDPEEIAVRWATSTEVVAVARPADESQVAEVLRWAAAERVTAVPIGTGRHMHRVVSPERCVLLSSARMRGIGIHEPADLTLTAGAGTTLTELRDALEPHDQWLPFDPPDVGGRTLGGLVAAGASGPLAAGYGALRNHVLGGTVVLGHGRTVRLGGRVVKNVAGFDLLRPMVGSLGGLGVLTGLCVRLFPTPQTDRLLVARADTASALVGAARAVARAAVVPASCVLVAGGDPLGGRAALLVRLHGPRPAVDADQRTFERAVGRPMEALESEPAAALLRFGRDHPHGAPGAGDGAGDATGVGVASAPPARLGNVLSALDSALGPVPFACDVLAGRVRFALELSQVPGIATVRRALDVLGGSLGVERAPAGAGRELDGAVSRPNPAETALAERVRSVFDAPGVFWRAGRAAGTGSASVHAGLAR